MYSSAKDFSAVYYFYGSLLYLGDEIKRFNFNQTMFGEGTRHGIVLEKNLKAKNRIGGGWVGVWVALTGKNRGGKSSRALLFPFHK